ncbi:DUF3231 family protein [Desulfoscipio sp. XC116]|uniref:DUF3231 family protein n=1 Tax=Desulfoscipio sp. XC116 TaxID=3144975 RepID=UPI00325BD63B
MTFFRNPRQIESAKLDVHEAYTLWRAYTDRNISIDHMNHLKNFIHDADFVVYLSKILADLKKESNTLEGLLQKYSIVGPEPAVEKHNTAGNSEIISDQNAAEVMHRFIRLDVNLMALSLKYTPTDDGIWSFIIELMKSAIHRIDNLIKYMKLKNWLFEPPLYPYVPAETKEKVATNEIALLWDHLIFRYHNIRQTQVFASLAADPDFILILNKGIEILQKEMQVIQDKLVYYGVSLPKHYTNITVIPEDKNIISDKYMLNTIMRGMRDAIALHASAIQEIIVNDKLRSFFTSLTFAEIDYLSKFTKYGKIKSWVFPTPTYKGGK